jgi:hypothetical protein
MLTESNIENGPLLYEGGRWVIMKALDDGVYVASICRRCSAPMMHFVRDGENWPADEHCPQHR